MKCRQCEHFKILFPPMGKYDNGQAKCEKYDLVVDFFGKQKLNNLTCIKEDGSKKKFCEDFHCAGPWDCPVDEDTPCKECPRHCCKGCTHYEECKEDGELIDAEP